MTDTTETTERPAFGGTYWLLNTIEMFERLAYFALRVLAPIYIMQASADNPGGLHLTAETKGWIYAWWAFFQSFLPIVTGGIADRFGFKRVLILSISANTAGYLLMAEVHSYAGFFGGVLLLATGTAFFKPALQGSLAQALTKQTASLGWGIFYWIVNVGSLIAHYLAVPLVGDRSADGWSMLFTACAVFSAANLLLLIGLEDVPSGADKTENVFQVVKRTVVNIFDPRLITWLLIMSCFWLMMYQLWDLQPNYIEDWVDSSMVAAALPDWGILRESSDWLEVRVPQQILISLNAAMIVLLMVPISWAVRKLRTLLAMFFGMATATCGVLVAGITGNGWVLLLGIALFSLGEMLTGPKKQEYLGLIAPPGKKGMYLGYVNIPVGLGVFVGSWMAGKVYGAYGEKATLALKYLMEHTPFGEGRVWDGSAATLVEVTGIERTAAFATLQETLGIGPVEATQLLWDTYHPNIYVWVPFAAIGVVAAVALYIFGAMAKRWKDMDA